MNFNYSQKIVLYFIPPSFHCPPSKPKHHIFLLLKKAISEFKNCIKKSFYKKKL